MLPLASIIHAVVQATPDNPEQLCRALGVAILTPARAGAVALTGQQLVLAQVMAGELGADAMLPVIRAEHPTIVRMVDDSMRRLFPRVRCNGRLYAWDDAKGDARTFTWYLATCARADSELLTQALSNALGGFALDDNRNAGVMVVSGQDPITICLVIIAVLGLASAVVALVNTAAGLGGPYVLPLIFPPKPLPSSDPNAPDAGGEPAASSGGMHPLLVLLLVLLFIDGTGSGKAAA